MSVGSLLLTVPLYAAVFLIFPYGVHNYIPGYNGKTDENKWKSLTTDIKQELSREEIRQPIYAKHAHIIPQTEPENKTKKAKRKKKLGTRIRFRKHSAATSPEIVLENPSVTLFNLENETAEEIRVKPDPSSQEFGSSSESVPGLGTGLNRTNIPEPDLPEVVKQAERHIGELLPYDATVSISEAGEESNGVKEAFDNTNGSYVPQLVVEEVDSISNVVLIPDGSRHVNDDASPAAVHSQKNVVISRPGVEPIASGVKWFWPSESSSKSGLRIIQIDNLHVPDHPDVLVNSLDPLVVVQPLENVLELQIADLAQSEAVVADPLLLETHHEDISGENRSKRESKTNQAILKVDSFEYRKERRRRNPENGPGKEGTPGNGPGLGMNNVLWPLQGIQPANPDNAPGIGVNTIISAGAEINPINGPVDGDNPVNLPGNGPFPAGVKAEAVSGSALRPDEATGSAAVVGVQSGPMGTFQEIPHSLGRIDNTYLSDIQVPRLDSFPAPGVQWYWPSEGSSMSGKRIEPAEVAQVAAESSNLPMPEVGFERSEDGSISSEDNATASSSSIAGKNLTSLDLPFSAVEKQKKTTKLAPTGNISTEVRPEKNLPRPNKFDTSHYDNLLSLLFLAPDAETKKVSNPPHLSSSRSTVSTTSKTTPSEAKNDADIMDSLEAIPEMFVETNDTDKSSKKTTTKSSGASPSNASTKISTTVKGVTTSATTKGGSTPTGTSKPTTSKTSTKASTNANASSSTKTPPKGLIAKLRTSFGGMISKLPGKETVKDDIKNIFRRGTSTSSSMKTTPTVKSSTIPSKKTTLTPMKDIRLLAIDVEDKSPKPAISALGVIPKKVGPVTHSPVTGSGKELSKSPTDANVLQKANKPTTDGSILNRLASNMKLPLPKFLMNNATF